MLYLHVISVYIERLMDLVLKSFGLLKREGTSNFRIASILNVGSSTEQ